MYEQLVDQGPAFGGRDYLYHSLRDRGSRTVDCTSGGLFIAPRRYSMRITKPVCIVTVP